jgi:hypothetical protein
VRGTIAWLFWGHVYVRYALLSMWVAGFQVSLLPDLKGTVPEALSIVY